MKTFAIVDRTDGAVLDRFEGESIYEAINHFRHDGWREDLDDRGSDFDVIELAPLGAI